MDDVDWKSAEAHPCALKPCEEFEQKNLRLGVVGWRSWAFAGLCLDPLTIEGALSLFKGHRWPSMLGPWMGHETHLSIGHHDVACVPVVASSTHGAPNSIAVVVPRLAEWLSFVVCLRSLNF